MASCQLQKPAQESCNNGGHEKSFRNKVTEMASCAVKACTEGRHEKHTSEHAMTNKQSHCFGQSHGNQHSVEHHNSSSLGSNFPGNQKKKHEKKPGEHADASKCKPKNGDLHKKKDKSTRNKDKGCKSGDSSSSSSSSDSD